LARSAPRCGRGGRLTTSAHSTLTAVLLDASDVKQMPPEKLGTIKMSEYAVAEIRPIATEELGQVEYHINHDSAAPTKHRDRLARQHKGEVAYLVAWFSKAPVGHVLIDWDGPAEEPMKSQLTDCPNLEDLFVVPQYRSRKIGSRLLDEAEGLVNRQGYPLVGLGVAVDNHIARRLYRQRGYEDAGFSEYQTGGHYYDPNGLEQAWEETCNYLVKRLQGNSSG
jgi:GNAT superfamily N-acetyltransferase